MQDPLVGTWKLNPAKSEFDPNHRPRDGVMAFEQNAEGHYLLTAEGTAANGEPCKEKPQKFVPDGRQHRLPDFPGLVAVTTRPDTNTLACEVRREDGSVVGGGTYVVSPDGTSLEATAFGYDSQLRHFRQKTVWDRQ